MRTVAETIAQELSEAGTRKVFGLPGGETVELLDEMRKHGIDFVFVRNEPSALFMADGYARACGRPGVCMTTLGPGAANAVVGVAHCYLDRAPVLILTAQKPERLLGEYTHQVIDLHALFKPITKSSTRLDAGNAQGAIGRALLLAQEGRPGPVHLQLSAEDATSEVEQTSGQSFAVENHIPQPSLQVLETAKAILSAASRPLIVAGLGLEPQRPYTQLQSVAEAVHAPVITTPKAKGALPDHHPLAAGTVGLTSFDPVYELFDEADCIVSVGLDVVELVKPWQYSGELIWVAPWQNYDPKLPASCELTGDVVLALEALASVTPSTDEAWGEARVSRLQESTAMPNVPEPPAGRITPQAALRIMRAQAADEAFLAVDVGSHKIFSSLEWPSRTANRFLVSNGLSSMGFALPAAIGALEAIPNSQVLCLTGDAGLSMNMGELGILVERNLPIVVIVFNDGAIDLIRSQQKRAGKPVFGTEFLAPNYTQIAAAFGLTSHRTGSEADFASVLATCLEVGNPALIEVMLDPTGYPTTPRDT